jgi:hypothetical protein
MFRWAKPIRDSVKTMKGLVGYVGQALRKPMPIVGRRLQHDVAAVRRTPIRACRFADRLGLLAELCTDPGNGLFRVNTAPSVDGCACGIREQRKPVGIKSRSSLNRSRSPTASSDSLKLGALLGGRPSWPSISPVIPVKRSLAVLQAFLYSPCGPIGLQHCRASDGERSHRMIRDSLNLDSVSRPRNALESLS